MQIIKKAISCSEKRRKLHENRLKPKIRPGAVLAEKIWGAWPPVTASAGARAYQGGLEADDILTVKHAIFGLNCTSNRTFLKAKTGSTVHKNIAQNGIRQRALQRIAEVAGTQFWMSRGYLFSVG